jgi:hypothetical protein
MGPGKVHQPIDFLRFLPLTGADEGAEKLEDVNSSSINSVDGGAATPFCFRWFEGPREAPPAFVWPLTNPLILLVDSGRSWVALAGSRTSVSEGGRSQEIRTLQSVLLE